MDNKPIFIRSRNTHDIGIQFNVSRCKSMTREKSKNAFVSFFLLSLVSFVLSSISFFFIRMKQCCMHTHSRADHIITHRHGRSGKHSSKKNWICVDINKYQKLIMRLVNAINVAKRANDDDHRSNEFTARTRSFSNVKSSGSDNDNDRSNRATLLAAKHHVKTKNMCTYKYIKSIGIMRHSDMTRCVCVCFFWSCFFSTSRFSAFATRYVSSLLLVRSSYRSICLPITLSLLSLSHFRLIGQFFDSINFNCQHSD